MKLLIIQSPPVPNIVIRTLFSKSISLYSSLRVTGSFRSIQNKNVVKKYTQFTVSNTSFHIKF
jgi:cbb3-type cytochrome oxidase subunit 1